MTSEQLRMARALLRLGIRELAVKAGVDKMVIVRLEAGKTRPQATSVARLKEALEGMGVVFIGAVEPFFSPTVAMRWGMEPPAEGEGEEGQGDEDEAGLNGLAWDEADRALGDEHRAALRRYWAAEGAWDSLSRPSRKALTKVIEGPLSRE